MPAGTGGAIRQRIVAKMDRLLITGASGQLGRRTAEYVLERVEPAQLADLAARGAQIRFGDFDDPGSLSSAFAGAKRLLLISAVDLAQRVEQHHAAIDAATRAGVNHIIYTSMLSPDAHNPAAVAPSHRQTETDLLHCGVTWTLLRNSLYADYQLPEARQAILHGRFVHNRGNGRIAYVTRDDCAAVAAAVLTSHGHANLAYNITGPHSYDPAELADVYAALGGRPVQALAVDDAAFIAGILGSGDHDGHARFGAELVASFGRAIRDNYLSACTTTVRELTGRPATTLDTVLRAALQPAPA
jgi:NAD(P)H dehydrogenase (quinone)